MQWYQDFMSCELHYYAPGRQCEHWHSRCFERGCEAAHYPSHTFNTEKLVEILLEKQITYRGPSALLS